jgi:hypothetical protein
LNIAIWIIFILAPPQTVSIGSLYRNI